MSKLTVSEMYGLDLSDGEVSFVIEYSKDNDARRAAVVAGYEPDTGYDLRKRPNVREAYEKIIQHRMDNSHYDAEWVKTNAADNHYIARQKGHINASNTALKLIGSLSSVDAFAAQRVEVSTDKDVMMKLQSARKRLQMDSDDDTDETSGDGDVSFF